MSAPNECTDACFSGGYPRNLWTEGLMFISIISGVRHEGEPEGKIERIAGVECYVASPTGDYPKDKVVLFLTDVFGIPLINNRLLADDFARNGFKTVMPDLFNGDPRVLDPPPTFDREAWMAKHRDPESWISALDSVVASLKESGVTRIGTTGYCFGAPPAFHLALNGESDVTVLAHPSRLVCPEDFEKYKAESKAPLLINSCEEDRMFPPEQQTIVDGIMGEGKFAPGYQRTYWDGCTHGFAVRGDLSDPKVKAGKEGENKSNIDQSAAIDWLNPGAFAASAKFFKKYL
ncbi:hypothetical protein EW026_g1923 [Hermanssonia centrifuga]|uniref:Dienelactone hydrolase domain-containing protein n=1 Tax=Hermanssonia centrifuga TaxID=98765 RepID=A0A4S4KUE5_9APHY|nr:hypothetical protein EW026_g1923 [Hermanssonia centrifuga]